MNIGSLFSGIGGLDLGLERAGMRVVWQCENDPYARAVLRKHWPGVPCYEDVRTLRAADLAPVDFLCGGFPCQDISAAGAGAGLSGERSGLWFHYARLLGALQPSQGALIECTPPWKRWLPIVRRHLHAAGYSSLPLQLRAADVGAPHIRKRIFILAHPDRERELQPSGLLSDLGGWIADSLGAATDADSSRLPPSWDPGAISYGAGDLHARPTIAGRGWWAVEPDVVRMVHGLPSRVDRIRCLGNAVVPQIAEAIGRLVMAQAKRRRPPAAPPEGLG